jgi:hypothetical protein
MSAIEALFECHGVARDDYQASVDPRTCEGVVYLSNVEPHTASFIHRDITGLMRVTSVGTMYYVRETSVKRVVDLPPWDFSLVWRNGKYMG